MLLWLRLLLYNRATLVATLLCALAIACLVILRTQAMPTELQVGLSFGIVLYLLIASIIFWRTEGTKHVREIYTDTLAKLGRGATQNSFRMTLKRYDVMPCARAGIRMALRDYQRGVRLQD